jgi:RHS repeat-associated protein
MLLARTSAAGVSAWYLTDRQGSVRDLVSTSGAVLNHVVYDAYGRVKSETNAANGDRFKYTGRETDAVTGLQSNRARYYDAVIGRWTQEDPIGFAAGDSNLYRYVGNSPTNWSDPSGLEIWIVKGIGTGSSGSSGAWHVGVVVYDPETGTGFIFDGDGYGFHEASSNPDKPWPKPLKPTMTPLPEDWRPPNDAYRLDKDGEEYCWQIERLGRAYRETYQIPEYHVWGGHAPNSNTWAQQLLRNAHYDFPEKIPGINAPGWGYSDPRNCYDGNNYDKHGRPRVR